MEDHAQLQPVLLWAAYWVGVLGRDSRRVEAGCGLLLGAALSHLGWAVLHSDRVAAAPLRLLDPGAGHTIMLLPLGPLLMASLCERADSVPGCRKDAALRALPLALAVARAGCVVAGCCAGRVLELASGAARPPLQWIELAGWLGLAWLLARVPPRRVGPIFCACFGALRLLLEPLRAPPPLGEPVLSPAWIALAWLIAGLVWGARRARSNGYSSGAS